MSAATPAPVVLGLCQCCDQPVRRGEDRTETVGTGGVSEATDVLLHRQACRPATETRRYS